MEVLLKSLLDKSIAFAPTALLALATLIIGNMLINWVSKLLANLMNRRGMDDTVQRFISNIVGVGLKVMLLLSIAGMFGIQTTSFIAIFTALAFAVGSALTGSLGHFASGIMLLTFRPYKVGDLVVAAGQTGTVEEIGVFNTTLLTPDNKKIIIPNGQVTGGVITNISGQGIIRVDMNYHISNSNNLDHVKSVIQKVSDACPYTLKDKSTDIFVNSLPVGMMEMTVRPWCKSEYFWETYFYMQENLKRAFDENNVALPKPGMDINLTQQS
jgi:small conductance mechanosensitive channel